MVLDYCEVMVLANVVKFGVTDLLYYVVIDLQFEWCS